MTLHYLHIYEVKGGEIVEVSALLNFESITAGSSNQKSSNQDLFSELFATLFANVQSPQLSSIINTHFSVQGEGKPQQICGINLENLAKLINQMKLNGSFNSANSKEADFTAVLNELGLNGDTSAMSEKLDELLKLDSSKPEQMLKLLNASIAKTDLPVVVSNQKVQTETVDAASTGLESLENKEQQSVQKEIYFNTDTESKILKQNEINLNNNVETKGLEQPEIKNSAILNVEGTLSNKSNPDVKIDAKEVVNIAKAEDLVEVVVHRFKSLRLPEITELRVKLRPEDLGDITIKVVLEKGQINGTIQAEKREVVNMLQSQMDNLKQDLRNNNVNLNNISVSIESDGSFEGRNQRHFAQDERRNARHVVEVFEENKVKNIEEGFDIIA